MAIRKVTIELDEATYLRLEKEAAEAGSAGVESYLSAQLEEETEMDLSAYDHLFTPERMAILRETSKQIDEGKYSDFDEAMRRVRKACDERKSS